MSGTYPNKRQSISSRRPSVRDSADQLRQGPDRGRVVSCRRIMHFLQQDLP